MPTYKIIRMYENGRKSRVIRRGLSIEEARKHCEDPETSSMTAAQPKGTGGNGRTIQKWHDLKKHWFDGFVEEGL